jgi:hypothetical protein
LFKGKTIFFIWYTGEEATADGFITAEHKIVVFNQMLSAENFAKNHMIQLEQDVTTYHIVDIDNLVDKINNLHIAENCRLLLKTWNIVSDMAKSIGTKYIGDSDDELTRGIYEKLFYGSNLSVITQQMEQYHPTFDVEETELCVSIFKQGLDLLESII